MQRGRLAYALVDCTHWFATGLFVLAGCQSVDDAFEADPLTESEPDAGADGGVVTMVTKASTPEMCTVEQVIPPAIMLSTSAGDQSGEQHSFCSHDQQRGCGFCVDTATITVKRFTVVHVGDQVRLGMADGTLVTPGPDRCQPACPPQLTVQALCSRDLVYSQIIVEDEAWTIDLAPGVYEIVASGSFSVGTVAGSTGDSFGLIVDDARERGIIEAGAPGTTCGSANTSSP